MPPTDGDGARLPDEDDDSKGASAEAPDAGNPEELMAPLRPPENPATDACPPGECEEEEDDSPIAPGEVEDEEAPPALLTAKPDEEVEEEVEREPPLAKKTELL